MTGTPRVFSTVFQLAALFLIALMIWHVLVPDRGIRKRSPPYEFRNIRSLMLAMHNYHDAHGHLPPAYIAGRDGKPWHSWRVLILPFLEEQELFERYDFDQPWNGPDNIRLLDQMPDVFRIREPFESTWWYWWFRSKPKTSYTRFVAITGSGTAFSGSKSISFADFTDGVSQTVCLTEYADGKFHWTEPNDISRTQWIRMITELGSAERYADRGASVAFADGSVNWLGADTEEPTLHALATHAAGDTPGDF